MTDIHLNVLDPAALERCGSKRDALRIGGEPARADELAPGLEALAPPSRIERLIAEHRAGVAEAQRERPIVELRGDHTRNAHRALAHQREERAVGVHETEEIGLLRAADTCGDRVQRLDQRRDHEAVSPRLEGLDEAIGEHPPSRAGADEIVDEAVRPSADRCAWRQRVEACHMGILRGVLDWPVQTADRREQAIRRRTVADGDPERPVHARRREVTDKNS